MCMSGIQTSRFVSSGLPEQVHYGIIGKSLEPSLDHTQDAYKWFRITIHNASWDYGGRYPRHGTRVTSLAEVPFFNPEAPTRRQALGLLDEDEKRTLGLD